MCGMPLEARAEEVTVVQNGWGGEVARCWDGWGKAVEGQEGGEA